MHRVTISILALSILAAPALLEAQTPRMQQRRAPLGHAVRVARNMQEQRATMQQHAQMRPDTQTAESRPAPMRRPAMMMRRPVAAAMRAGMGAQPPEELRAVMQQMRQNTARATEQLMQILAADQRATLRTLRTGR
ncbi:hypothetical protein BH23GEM10_BH23GEM10_02470 [soil metagenome]